MPAYPDKNFFLALGLGFASWFSLVGDLGPGTLGLESRFDAVNGFAIEKMWCPGEALRVE